MCFSIAECSIFLKNELRLTQYYTSFVNELGHMDPYLGLSPAEAPCLGKEGSFPLPGLHSQN